MGTPAVRVGQVWVDNDPRTLNYYESERRLMVLRIQDGRAYCSVSFEPDIPPDAPVAKLNSTPRSHVWVKLARFKPTRTGFRLLHDLP